MRNECFEVKRERFDLKDRSCYRLQGTLPWGSHVRARIASKEVPCSVQIWDNTEILEQSADLEGVQGEKVTVTVQIPEKLKPCKKLKIEAFYDGGHFIWFTIPTEELVRKRETIQYFLEEKVVDFQAEVCQIRGWAVGIKPVAISLIDCQGHKVICDIQRMNRPDVVEMYEECQVEGKCGFFVSLSNIKGGFCTLVFESNNKRMEYRISLNRWSMLAKKAAWYYKKCFQYLHVRGIRALVKKVFQKVRDRRRESTEYQKWLLKHLPTKEELKQQRKTDFLVRPLFSIVVPLYRTPRKYLMELLVSLKNQTYENWELCLSDGSGQGSPLARCLEQLQKDESRIKVIVSDSPLKISENTNRAIQIAAGDFLVFADHDDTLASNALYECAKMLNEHSGADIIYTDEDKMSIDGNKFFQPHFKPDFNIDLLRTVNYICHLFVVKRDLQREVGELCARYDGAQDYDFILRCVEKAGDIRHIPKILYHWRSHEKSTSENPESKLYAFDAGRRAIQAHYERMHIEAQVFKGEYLGLYRTRYKLHPKPMISILIPNKDHIDDLKRCISSIENKSSYENYEYIIIENNSTDQATFDYYKKLEVSNSKAHVVSYKGKFNYSAINNFGAGFANGEYLWLLNNDTEIINEDCIEELVGYCTREDVGIVGARLYYEDNSIQHAGVVIGFGGIAGHCFVQQPRGSTGYCHRIICAQDYSAVTAACMMVKRSVFEAVGGLTEKLEVAFNDIDFCMKVRRLGKLVVYNPYAELYHYESKSRGLEDTPEKIRRFQREIAIFKKRWPEILRSGDPYYNPNLTLESQNFSLKAN